MTVFEPDEFEFFFVRNPAGRRKGRPPIFGETETIATTLLLSDG